MFFLFQMAEREVRVERSLGRVRGYRERLSIYDEESGFYADWYFGLRLREEIARSARYDQPFTLVLIEDLARGLGESLRTLVFRCLDETLRTTDMVAHINDSRFVVLLTNTHLRGALVAMRRIRESLLPEGIHVGIACYPEDGPDALSLLAAAGASADLISAVTRGAESIKMETLPADRWLEGSEAEEDVEVADESACEEEADNVPPNVIDLRQRRLCSVPGCDRPHHARAMCAMHYAQSRRNAA
jgi:GGDEF domain-containing protein